MSDDSTSKASAKDALALRRLATCTAHSATIRKELVQLDLERDDLIRQALQAGATLRAVASVAGMSHVRVAQIRDTQLGQRKGLQDA